VGRDSAVGIATRYGLDGPGSNPVEGEIFSTHLARSLVFIGYWDLSQVLKRPGRGFNHPPPFGAEVKERV